VKIKVVREDLPSLNLITPTRLNKLRQKRMVSKFTKETLEFEWHKKKVNHVPNVTVKTIPEDVVVDEDEVEAEVVDVVEVEDVMMIVEGIENETMVDVEGGVMIEIQVVVMVVVTIIMVEVMVEIEAEVKEDMVEIEAEVKEAMVAAKGKDNKEVMVAVTIKIKEVATAVGITNITQMTIIKEAMVANNNSNNTNNSRLNNINNKILMVNQHLLKINITHNNKVMVKQINNHNSQLMVNPPHIKTNTNPNMQDLLDSSPQDNSPLSSSKMRIIRHSPINSSHRPFHHNNQPRVVSLSIQVNNSMYP